MSLDGLEVRRTGAGEGDARLHEQVDHHGRDDRQAAGVGEVGSGGEAARAEAHIL